MVTDTEQQHFISNMHTFNKLLSSQFNADDINPFMHNVAKWSDTL